MHNSFGVAAGSPPPGGAVSAGFLLFDFAVSRKAIPPELSLFSFPAEMQVLRGKFLLMFLGLCENFKVFFFNASEMTFMSAPLEKLDRYSLEFWAFYMQNMDENISRMLNKV